MDETYVKVAGQWKYLYRAVDRDGDTIDFLLRAKRDCAAARKFLERSIALHGEPDKITIEKSGSNIAAIASYNAEHEAAIVLRQSSTSTTSSSKIIGRSSASCGPCWGSRPFAA
jgi:putative transposase